MSGRRLFTGLQLYADAGAEDSGFGDGHPPGAS